MKTKFINLLVSILYVPLLFIGQLIGNIIGMLLTPIILNFDLLWISYIFNLLSEIFKFNWNEKTGLQKIQMIVFYSVLLYLLNIILWFIK